MVKLIADLQPELVTELRARELTLETELTAVLTVGKVVVPEQTALAP